MYLYIHISFLRIKISILLLLQKNLYFGVCKNRGISSVYTAIDVGEVVCVVSPFENVSAVKYIS